MHVEGNQPNDQLNQNKMKTGYITKQDNAKYVVGRNSEKFQHCKAKQYDTLAEAEKAAAKRKLEITVRYGF